MFDTLDLKKYGITQQEIDSISMHQTRLGNMKDLTGGESIKIGLKHVTNLSAAIGVIVYKISNFHMHPINEFNKLPPPQLNECFSIINISINKLHKMVKQSKRELAQDLHIKLEKSLVNICPLSETYIQSSFYESLQKICQRQCDEKNSKKLCDQINSVLAAKTMIDEKSKPKVADYENYFKRWDMFYSQIIPFLFLHYVTLLRVNVTTCLRQWCMQEIALNSSMYLQMMTLRGQDDDIITLE